MYLYIYFLFVGGTGGIYALVAYYFLREILESLKKTNSLCWKTDSIKNFITSAKTELVRIKIIIILVIADFTESLATITYGGNCMSIFMGVISGICLGEALMKDWHKGYIFVLLSYVQMYMILKFFCTTFSPEPYLAIWLFRSPCFKQNLGNAESGNQNEAVLPDKTGLVELLIKVIFFVLLITIGIIMHKFLNDISGTNYYPSPIHEDCG